jgi:arginase
MIKILGIPYDMNSSFMLGASQGPRMIIKMHHDGSANAYCENGYELDFGKQIIDSGDIDFGIATGEEAYQIILDRVKEEIKDDVKLISLGGDHSIAYPTISAHYEKYGPVNVIQIDAHGDLYENFGNNPYSHASPFARLHEEGKLGRHLQLGIRSLNPHQRDQIRRYGVECIEMKDHHLNWMEDWSHPTYISLDLDGIDPSSAPGVSHHEPGGFTTRDVLDIIHKLKGNVIGAEIVELNPRRDIHNMTAMLGYKLMKEIASKMLFN